MEGTLYLVFVDTINRDLSYKAMTAIRKSDFLAVHKYEPPLEALDIVSEIIPGIKAKKILKITLPLSDEVSNTQHWQSIITLLKKGIDVVFIEPLAPTMFQVIDFIGATLEKYKCTKMDILGAPLELIDFIRLRDEEYFYLLKEAGTLGWTVASYSNYPNEDDFLDFKHLESHTGFSIFTKRDPDVLLATIFEENIPSEQNHSGHSPKRTPETFSQIINLVKNLHTSLQSYREQKKKLEELLKSENLNDIEKLWSILDDDFPETD